MRAIQPLQHRRLSLNHTGMSTALVRLNLRSFHDSRRPVTPRFSALTDITKLKLRTAPTNAMYINFFMWSKMWSPPALQGAEGTHSAETTETRTTESCSTIFALHKLPQQLALRTPQRRVPNDPKSQNRGVPVMMYRTVNDPSRRAGPDLGRANRSPRTTHRDVQDLRKASEL